MRNEYQWRVEPDFSLSHWLLGVNWFWTPTFCDCKALYLGLHLGPFSLTVTLKVLGRLGT